MNPKTTEPSPTKVRRFENNQTLIDLIKAWDYRPAQAATLLGIHRSRMSDFIHHRRELPKYLLYSAQAHDRLTRQARDELLNQRLLISSSS